MPLWPRVPSRLRKGLPAHSRTQFSYGRLRNENKEIEVNMSLCVRATRALVQTVTTSSLLPQQARLALVLEPVALAVDVLGWSSGAGFCRALPP